MSYNILSPFLNLEKKNLSDFSTFTDSRTFPNTREKILLRVFLHNIQNYSSVNNYAITNMYKICLISFLKENKKCYYECLILLVFKKTFIWLTNRYYLYYTFMYHLPIWRLHHQIIASDKILVIAQLFAKTISHHVNVVVY